MEIEIKPLGMTVASIKGIIPRLIAPKLKEAGIPYTFDQMIVLLVVRRGPKTQQDIAEMMRKDKSVILRIVDILEKDGLLYRATDPNDRRINIINLTDSGMEYTDRFKAIETEISIQLFKGLKTDEIEAFYKVIDHIQIAAENL